MNTLKNKSVKFTKKILKITKDNNIKKDNTKKDNTKKDNTNKDNTKKANKNLKSFSISFNNRLSLNKDKSYSIKKFLFNKDILIDFIDDNQKNLKNGMILKNNIIDKYIFNDSKEKCICENIYKKHLADSCKCEQMKSYSSQGKSGATIHSIKCDKIKNILKVIQLNSYYFKMRMQTKKYMFIEFDGFSIQTIINTYVHKELPNNSVNIINSGVCIQKNKKYNGYNLMEEADLGSGLAFFNNLLAGLFDNEFNINDEDTRYKTVINFLLQVVLIIGHLQSSSLEFFHGDYKPENVFVKRINKTKLQKFKFNIFGKEIYIKNMGFAVLIADFDRSSISINSDSTNIKYRIIPPILFKPLLTNYVNNIIKKYGDIDPDSTDKIKMVSFFISKFIPISKDPSITILRSAGVKTFRDFDLYTFFIRLLNNNKIREYFKVNKIDNTILSFMSDNFKNKLFLTKSKTISLNEAAFIAIQIFDEINEPMHNVFTKDYFKTLKILNYKLFKN